MRKQWSIVAICIATIVWYNGLFLRTEPHDTLTETVNPLSYLAHATIERQKPDAVFQAPVFPEYARYCYSSQKLCQFIPLQSLYTDLLWIRTIQYIGSQPDVTDSKGIFTLLDTITTLSPWWIYPYTFGQLILPLQKNLEEVTSGGNKIELQKESRNNTVYLAKKGEYFLCDAEKIYAITGMTEEEFIRTLNDRIAKEKYKNPCPTHELPHYTAFNYFNFLGDAVHAADQYKISAFQDDAPPLTATIAALIYGRGGDHLKSATLWYDRYLALAENTTGDAQRALNKALFEIQLQLITEAAESHKECATSYTCLQKAGAIKESITHTLQNLCDAGKNRQNIRCILVYEGAAQGLIGIDGTLTYPGNSRFQFVWSDDYHSWRAIPTY